MAAYSTAVLAADWAGVWVAAVENVPGCRIGTAAVELDGCDGVAGGHVTAAAG